MLKKVRNRVEHEIVINKSRFIGILIPLDQAEDSEFWLEEIRQEYPDASHHCYAWIHDAKRKVSDDGEPSKTAGLPMLNVLEKQQLDHILAVVVRYFGGIKLGAGGLVRAYTQAVVSALDNAQIVTKVSAPYYAFCFDYHFTRQMDHLFKNEGIDILKKDYQEKVTYECFILNEKLLDVIQERFSNQIEMTCLKFADVEIKGDI